MAITRIASQDATASGTPSATATYAATPTPGSLLVAIIAYDSTNAVGSISSSGWTFGVGGAVSASTNIDLYYKTAGVAESTSVATTTDVGSTIYTTIFEYKIGSGANGVREGVSITAQGSSTATLTASSGTTAALQSASELVIAVFFWPSSTQTLTSYTNSFTSRIALAGHVFVADKNPSGSGAQSTTITVTGTAGAVGALIVTFREAIKDRTSNMGKYISVGDGMGRSEVAF